MILKIVYKQQIHIAHHTKQISYSELILYIQNNFKKLPASFTLTYLDEDSDLISLLNDSDLQVLYELRLNKVTLEVNENLQQFQDQTQIINLEADHKEVSEDSKNSESQRIKEIHFEEEKEKIENKQSKIEQIQDVQQFNEHIIPNIDQKYLFFEESEELEGKQEKKEQQEKKYKEKNKKQKRSLFVRTGLNLTKNITKTFNSSIDFLKKIPSQISQFHDPSVEENYPVHQNEKGIDSVEKKAIKSNNSAGIEEEIIDKAHYLEQTLNVPWSKSLQFVKVNYKLPKEAIVCKFIQGLGA